jgi:hypothetical protein
MYYEGTTQRPLIPKYLVLMYLITSGLIGAVRVTVCKLSIVEKMRVCRFNLKPTYGSIRSGIFKNT